MSCLLTKEMQEVLLGLIANQLHHKSYKPSAEGTFSLDDYIREMYDFVLESSNGNEALALDAARLVPKYIDSILALDEEIAEELEKENEDIRINVIKKAKEFKKDLENVRTTLGLNVSKIEDDIDAIEEFINTPVIEEPIVPVPAEQEIKAAEWWNTLPMGAFITYGSELKETGKEDPANKFNATAIRAIANQLKEKGLSNSSELEAPIFLKIMQAGKANLEILNRPQYSNDKGMIAILVNKSGKPIKMNYAGESKPVYFKLYSPVPLITKNGKKVIDMNKSSFIDFVKKTSEISTVGPSIDKYTKKEIFSADQNKTAMANSLYKKIKTTYDNLTRQYLEAGMSEKEAENTALEELSKDFEIFENMRNYVEDQGKSVKAVITGASLGFVIVDQYNPVPIKNIYGDQVFEPISVKKDEIGTNLKKGVAYFNYPGISKPITIAKPFLVEMPELMEKVISLFTDVLKDSKGNPISIANRNKLIQQFLLKDYTNIGFVPTKDGTGFVFKDGTYKIRINDEYMSFSYDEKDSDLRKKIADALRNAFSKPSINAESLLEIDANTVKNYNINVITELTGPISKNTVLLKDGKYYKVHMPYVEVVGEYINKAFEMPQIANGVLTTETKIYNDFIKDNFSANVRVGANNKIEAYNPTLSYAPTLESFAEFSATPEVQEEIKKSQEPNILEQPTTDTKADIERLLNKKLSSPQGEINTGKLEEAVLPNEIVEESIAQDRDGNWIEVYINNPKLQGVLLARNGNYLFRAMQGRFFVIAKVGNFYLPFYISSAGTSGKNEGEWYPFFGYNNWLVKGSVGKKGEMEYSEKVSQVQKLLNDNFRIPAKFFTQFGQITNGKGTPVSPDKVFYDISKHVKYESWFVNFDRQKDNKYTEEQFVADRTGLNPKNVVNDGKGSADSWIRDVVALTEDANTASKGIIPNAELDALEGKSVIDTKTDAPATQDPLSENDIYGGLTLDKKLSQKLRNEKAREEFTKAAKEWYENSPIFKDPKTGETRFAYDTVFRAVNDGQGPVAQWAVHGIVLYHYTSDGTPSGKLDVERSGDFTDLYHEAWHAFTQTFLTPEERKNLYKEARKRQGSFQDYDGKYVTFANADVWQLEEFLAEEFREYMMSGGKKAIKGSPATRSIFKKILDFLKALFNKVNPADIIKDPMSHGPIFEMYENLRMGNLSSYNFSLSNRDKTIGSLNSLQARDSNTDPKISVQNANMLVNSIDSLISQIATQMSNLSGGDRSYITEVMSTSSRRKSAYKKVLETLINKKKALQEEYNKLSIDNPVDSYRRKELKEYIELLEWATGPNFGDIENLTNNKDNKGLIAYHAAKSRYLSEEDKESLFEEDELDETKQNEESRGQGFDRSGNEVSQYDLAAPEIKYLLRSIHKYDDNGLPIKNAIGIHELTDTHVVWNKIARTLNGVMDMDKMWAELDIAAHQRNSKGEIIKTIDPTLSELLNKLGDTNLQTDSNAALWIKFWGTFNMVSIPLLQMTVETTTRENGETSTKMTVGQTNSASRRTFNLWKNAFRSLNSDFIIRDLEEETSPGKQNPGFNKNYLDIDTVIKAYSDTKNNLKDAPNFLRAIGVRLSDKESINTAINNNVGNAKIIFNKLKTLSNNDIKRVYSLDDIFKEYEDLGLASDKANLTAFGNLENKYSDYTSNYAQTNAEGNTQYELSLHNSMSIMVHTINASPDYKSLIKDNPHMAYLDIKTNPFAKSSSWLNSIFEIRDAVGNLIPEGDPRFGKRRVKDGGPIKLNMSNLSGIQMVKDNVSDGISSAGSDEFTKMIMDFHMNLKGRPELVRHADKGTSFSLWIQNIEGGPKEGGYVSTTSFFADDQGNIEGYSSAVKMMMNYLEAEMTRISKMKDLQEKIKKQEKVGEIIYDAAYVKEGQKFLIFEDILNKETQESLIKIKDFNKISESMRNKISQEIEEYFIDQFEKVKKVFEKNAFIDPTTATTFKIEAAKKGKITGSVASSQIRAASDKRRLTLTEDAMVRSFVVNNWIHNIESMSIIYGDIAQYNMKKEEFHKRNAGFGSTGNLLSTSRPVINYINSKGRKYAAAKGFQEKQLASDGSIQTAVLADSEIPSAYFDEIREAIAENLTEKNNALPKNRQLSKEALDEKIYEATVAYGVDKKGIGQMKEGDAQGWITFDFYRAASIAEGKWTSVQERLYNDIVSGKPISRKEATEFFPTKKYQYCGPVEYRKNENGQFVRDEKGELIPTMAFHKFSLFPLIPNVITNTNLEKLHEKMMKQGIDYAVFQSGSKISTLSKIKTDGEKDADKFYTKNRDFDQDSNFTPNTIYLQFLKNQLEIAPYFKEEVTFPTQMRKLIENGIMEGGVPTDFEIGLPLSERRKKWDELDDAGKLDKSEYFKLVKNYETDLANLTAIKKEKLIKEANIKFKTVNGKRVAQIDEQLIKFIQGELTRQELGEHEVAFLKTKDGGNGIAHDLSISLSSEKLEKILNSIVVKRLVRQKFKGEGLIQVSGAGWETNLRGELTPEEKLKYGTNELPFYTRTVISVDKNGKKVYGKTKAMKVKIALQGDFVKLLELKHKDGRVIKDVKEGEDPLTRLNEMLKDEEWLNIDNHRDMISITGPRIPTQENNSMEFAEVYEFLPEQAGNIVVLPSEIVAKSGGDFDIDKITFMFPNIKAKVDLKNVDFKLFAEKYGKTEQEIKELLDKKGKDKTEEDNKILDDIYNSYPKEVSLPLDFQSEKGLENRILKNMREILALKDNYVSLVRPNGTDLIKPLADDLANKVMTYNPKNRFRGDASSVIAGTRIFEIQYNLYKHSSNNIGKATLGIGAVDNTYNTVYNRIGMHMNKTYITRGGVEKELRILLPHNTLINKDGDEVISLSNLYDATGETSISSVIAQLINGWVDIAKDAWIFNIQGNKEISPTLLFMIQAGVPVDQAVYMASHPLVRKYVEEQKLAKSLFAESLGKGDKNPMYFRNAARKEVFKTLFDDDVLENLSGKAAVKDAELKRLTEDYINNSKEDFSTDVITKEELAGLPEKDVAKWQGKMKVSKNLYDRIDKKENWDDTDKAIFLHFIELEEMSKVMTKIKSNTNYDTNPSLSLFEAQRKINMLAELKDEQMVPTEMIEKIVKTSPISSFYVQDFQIELWQDLFKLRNNEELNAFILEKLDDFNEFNDVKDATFGDAEKTINEFRNDLPSFIFQNSLRAFDLNAKFYKGLEISETGTEIKQISNLRHGVFVKNGVLYVNKEQLKKDYDAIQLNKFDYKVTLEDGTVISVAPVKKADFKTPERYYSFIFEREMLRDRWKNKFEVLAERADTQAKIKFYESSMAKEEKETDEHFQGRVKTVVFEEMIRDMALDNTFNESKIFRSNESMADQLTQIQILYPELSSKYSFINALSASYLETGVDKISNIMLNDSMIDDPEKINIFHQNLLELSNPGTIKINTESAIERERVADFFNRLTIFAFLQSGMNTKGMYSLIRLVPQEKFTELMTLYSADFLNNINNITLERYWQKFKNVNSNRKTRTRMRDYTINFYNPEKDYEASGNGQASVKDAENYFKKATTVSKEDPKVTFEKDVYDNTLYDANGIGISSANKAIQENPDLIFAINGVLVKPGEKMPGGADKNEAALFGVNKGISAVGLPTRSGFAMTKTNELTGADVYPGDKPAVEKPKAPKEAILEPGQYVKFNGQDFIVIKQNANGTWLIYNPTLEGVNAKKSVSAVNMKIGTAKGNVVTYKDAEYIVTPKGTIISLTTNKIMKWDENNGDRKAILALATQPTTQPSTSVEITKSNYTRQEVQNNPNTAFVFTENNYSITAFPNRSGGGSAVIRPEPNAFAIVTKKKYDYNTRENVDYSDTEADFKEFTEVNTRLINELKNSGKSKIKFPQGFATDKAKMPTRFAEWLQKALLDNFGLVTELNSTKTGLISKSTQPSTSVKPSDFTNYHGGAKKYDAYWEQEGKNIGVTKHTVYTVDSYDKLDQATKDKLEARYDAARTWLGRSSLSKDKYAGKLVRRDMMQAAKADAIFAVSEIVAPNIKGRKGYVNKTNHPIIEGGTGYAVASGILLNKPVYVFNQDSSYGYETGWYKWDSSTNDFVKTDIPVLTKNYAGIGSSTNETEIGRQAIRDVYANTFKATQPAISSTREFLQTAVGQGIASTGKTETGDDSKTIRPINSTVINPLLKQQIDSAISTLKDYRAQGKTIAFSKYGYGQWMIGANDLTGELKDNKIVPIAPQAFVYLSKQLWENFKYVNPNFDTALGFTKMPNVLQENAEVTDEDVLEALSFCFKT